MELQSHIISLANKRLFQKKSFITPELLPELNFKK